LKHLVSKIAGKVTKITLKLPKKPVGSLGKEHTEILSGPFKEDRVRILNNEGNRKSRLKRKSSFLGTDAKATLNEQQPCILPKRPVGRPRKEQTEVPSGISKEKRARILNNAASRRSRLKKRLSFLDAKAKIALLEQQSYTLKTQISELTNSINVYKNLKCKCGLDSQSQFMALLGLQRKI
jgi:hypothetical protein